MNKRFPKAAAVGVGLAVAGAVQGAPAPAPAERLQWGQLPPLPDHEGFAGMLAGVSGGALLVAGGSNFPDKRPWEGGVKRWYDTVFVLGSPTGQWIRAGRLPQTNASAVSLTVPDGVLCAGGGNAERNFSEVYLLSWDGRELRRRELPSLPRTCGNAAGALLGSTVYVAGGFERPDSVAALRTFWALDLAAPDPGWKELEPWPGPERMLSVAGVSGGSFYLFGGTLLRPGSPGRPSRTYLTDAYAFAPGRGWRRLADMPRAAVAAPSPAPTLSDGRLLVVTGDDGKYFDRPPGPGHPGFPRDAFAYDPHADRWIACGSVPISRGVAPAVAWLGRWAMPGGEQRPGVRTPEVWTVSETAGPAK